MEKEIREQPDDERDDGPVVESGTDPVPTHASGDSEAADQMGLDGLDADRVEPGWRDAGESGEASPAEDRREAKPGGADFDDDSTRDERPPRPDGDDTHDDRSSRPASEADLVVGEAGVDIAPPAPREEGRETSKDEPPREVGVTAEDPSGEASFGTWLRRQREMREISLEEIADKTKIGLRYLKAMEEDRFDVLPAPVFARGFLRDFSRYVGLNPDEVVNYYLASHEGTDLAASEEPVTLSSASRGPVSKRSLVLLIVTLLAAVALYAYFYQNSKASREQAEPPPIAAPISPLEALPPEPEAEKPAAAAAPLVVTLDFTKECWVEAEVDRSRRTTQLFVAGESLQLEAQEIVVLETLGDANGVEVQVNGEPYELPPSDGGTTVRNVVLDRDSFAPAAAGSGDG